MLQYVSPLAPSRITLLIIPSPSETGLFADFKKIPFAAEIFVKDRFTALSPVEGAGQEQAMPSS
jgi:hypothetical protein